MQRALARTGRLQAVRWFAGRLQAARAEDAPHSKGSTPPSERNAKPVELDSRSRCSEAQDDFSTECTAEEIADVLCQAALLHQLAARHKPDDSKAEYPEPEEQPDRLVEEGVQRTLAGTGRLQAVRWFAGGLQAA